MIIDIEEAEARLKLLDQQISVKERQLSSQVQVILSSDRDTLLFGALST